MISLLFNEIASRLKSSPSYKALMDQFQKEAFPLTIQGPQGLYQAFLIGHLAQKNPGLNLVILPTDQEAEDLARDLGSLEVDAEYFPWWGTLLYQGVSAQASIFGQRSRILARLARGEALTLTLSLKNLLFPVPGAKEILPHTFVLKKGNQINVTKTAQELTALGYMRVPRVTVPGEFALRGEVLDLYRAGDAQAVRVVFDFDTIEDMKTFDPLSQSSTGSISEFLVWPGKERFWSEDTLGTLAKNLPGALKPGASAEGILEELKEKRETRGEELFFPLSYENPESLFSYLKADALVFLPRFEALETQSETIEREFAELYRAAASTGLVVPKPQNLFLNWTQEKAKLRRYVRLPALISEDLKTSSLIQLPCDPPRSFFGNIPFLKEEIATLAEYGNQIFVFASSASQARRLEFVLEGLPVKIFDQNISAGFSLPQQKIVVIQENEIFGRRKKTPASLKKVSSQVIESFVDLSPGDHVVHINYGIGKFLGIDRVKTSGSERDYIKILYADEETVFIPIEQVNLIQRYIGSENRDPKLDTLGGPSWEKKKARVKKAVEELADRLILLYAKRLKATGFQFPPDNDWQASFEAAFPYDETPDQIQAVEEIKADMESPRPMDRLLCGDVGYGKTEVAMRACFKAAVGGKQVAFLAPTTILAEQHFENFQERFKRFPVRIGMLSRFVDKKQQKETLAKVAAGEIDILIGTHRILQKDVVYKNLGLVVVDEEQRFGVKDKERLKELKTSIDSLALSATPIPRTLHMSLLKIRDMSVLRTAPVNRHPIETFIQEFQSDTIARAIRREVERGGQVFFLHNRVETLEATQLFLQELVPEVLIRHAHGQMNPEELEEVMHDFIHGNFHVLVSTTIIENGIDIPNVNTIIIDRADMYGISQLYQLRGRVGRSGRLAYAYLLYPKERALTELAMKRLQVISDFTELGSGFKVAMKDLEVRGAGNLLGAEQSGEILAVGFELFLKLLDEAVAKRSTDGETEETWEEIFLELDYSGFIPDTYIQDPTDKMEVYKKISSVVTEDDLDRVFAEVHDRFGPPPEEVHSLFSLSEIRVLCRKLKISSLRERGGLCTVEFGKMKDFPFDKALKLLKESGGKVKSLPQKPNVLVLETSKVGLKEKSAFIRETLGRLL